MPAAVSHNSVSRNVLLQMFVFSHIHVHCITYNSEINNSSYSYSYQPRLLVVALVKHARYSFKPILAHL